MSDTVVLAIVNGGASSRTVGSKGRVVVDDEVWTVARDAAQVGEIMRARGVPRGAKRDRVFTELQLAGYWPTRIALRDYVDGSNDHG